MYISCGLSEELGSTLPALQKLIENLMNLLDVVLHALLEKSLSTILTFD